MLFENRNRVDRRGSPAPSAGGARSIPRRRRYAWSSTVTATKTQSGRDENAVGAITSRVVDGSGGCCRVTTGHVRRRDGRQRRRRGGGQRHVVAVVGQQHGQRRRPGPEDAQRQTAETLGERSSAHVTRPNHAPFSIEAGFPTNV